MVVRSGMALLAAALLGGCAATGAAPAGERGIVVEGTGRVASPPDTALVEVGREARAARLADATADVDRTMTGVLARVKALGVPDADVRTVAYDVTPIPEPRAAGDAGAGIAGYRVANVMQVRLPDVRGVGRLVDAAVAAGANVVRNVHFTLADPSAAEARARALAVQDAAARARQVAAAAGVGLGPLLSVRESAPVRPVARMTLATTVGPVEPGLLEVTVRVEARYAIAP